MNLLPLVALAVLGQPQGRPDTHTLGKTPKEVVAMGRSKWFDYYTDKQGSSAMAMADAERTFATCLASLTNEKIAKLPEAKQAEYRQLRDLMRESGIKAVECGSALTGGGTLWINVSAGQEVDVEEVMADLVAMPRKPRSASQASFWKEAAAVKVVIEKNSDDINEFAGEQGMKAPEVLQRLESLKSDFSAVVKLITPWSAAQRGRVIAYYVETVDLIDEQM